MTEDDDNKFESSLSEFYGKRFGPCNGDEEESLTPIADEELKPYLQIEEDKEDPSISIVERLSKKILRRFRFITIEENREILIYDKGVYVNRGEIVIEKTAESLCGYEVANKHIAEIKGHIMRLTYHKREELDADVNIINLKNGLYNIETGKFKEHTPDYLSITQKPFPYTPDAKPKMLGKYLSEVLYPTEIRTAIEVMAYTLYKDNPYEYMVKLFGYGANGKSVFTGLLTALHGPNNISNVDLKAMSDDPFALSDLENKYINIDTETSSQTIKDTTIVKKLTGRQPIRIQRKNQKAYDTILFAKLISSANKIPEIEDESDAFFRRDVIISFPNRFDGKDADPNLLKKLTSEEELFGIFNILVKALRGVLERGGIYLAKRTIEERREKHQLAVDPIGFFLNEAISPESIESDKTSKDDLYEAYKRFCRIHTLAVESKISFGRKIKGRFQEYREPSGERRTMWKGIKLKEEYCIDIGQQQLSDLVL
jgi:P4 family phage/plasmid primase-like protien